MARQFASLDHLCGGRAAWNVVTSWDAFTGENFRRGGFLAESDRYSRATQFLATATELFDSWPAGAIVADRASRRFLRAEPNPESARLTAADVPEILDLIARTRPGPFRPRTIELGSYPGIRQDRALVAMAGERMRPPGWTEISAVCTDPAYRGRGPATSLVRAVAAGIRARGETPFLHTAASNAPAIRLYESIGFRLRRRRPSAATG